MNFPPIILASKSPRRQQLLKLMGLDFKLVLKDVDESFPERLSHPEVVVFIAEKKAKAFDHSVTNEIVVTADTLVAVDEQILGKPETTEHAVEMLQLLSGRMHEVYTGVTLFHEGKYHSFYDRSEVYFRTLSEAQIRYYVETHKPMDKAGAYGIQEWIGLIGIEKIVGSYTNVVGLPTEKFYQALLKRV